MDGPLNTNGDLHLLLVPPVREELGCIAPMPKLSEWHRQLWSMWSPVLRKVAPTTELDQPESSLPHHIQRVRKQGKNPVVIQFRPPHQVYPWPEAPLVTASHWDHGTVPCRALFKDVRWNWSLTLPFVQGLLTASPLTRDAWNEGGFTGQTFFMGLGNEGAKMAAGNSSESMLAHRLPVGPGGCPDVQEIWQEEAQEPRGLTKRTYFWARKTYHHQIKEKMPGWINRSALGGWKWVRKQFKKPTAPAWMHPAPMDNPACVIVVRWDPLSDHWAGVRVLAACAKGLSASHDTALVVRMPEGDGRWSQRLNELSKVAERLPSWHGALLAQSDQSIHNPGDCLPRLDWAITWETDLNSSLWAESLKQSGVGVIGTDASCMHHDPMEFPGLQVATTQIPCSFQGVEDKLLESWRPHPRVESLSKAVSSAVSTTLAGNTPSFGKSSDLNAALPRLGQFLKNLAQQQATGRMVA